MPTGHKVEPGPCAVAGCARERRTAGGLCRPHANKLWRRKRKGPVDMERFVRGEAEAGGPPATPPEAPPKKARGRAAGVSGPGAAAGPAASRWECVAASRPQDGRTANEDSFLVGRGAVPFAALCDGAGNAERAAKRALGLFGKLIAEATPAQIAQPEAWAGWVRLLDSALLGGGQSTFVSPRQRSCAGVHVRGAHAARRPVAAALGWRMDSTRALRPAAGRRRRRDAPPVGAARRGPRRGGPGGPGRRYDRRGRVRRLPDHLVVLVVAEHHNGGGGGVVRLAGCLGH